MNTKIQKQIVLILFLIILNVNSVNAETGTLQINVGTSSTYINTDAVSSFSANLTNFSFDNVNYNYIKKVTFKFGSSADFYMKYEFEESEFDIISGGTGSGYATYDKTARNYTFYFNGPNGAHITSPYFVVTFPTDNGINISSNVQFKNYLTNCRANTGATKPVELVVNKSGSDSCVTLGGSGFYYSSTSKIVTNTYNVTYPDQDIFKVEIDKSNSETVATKIRVVDLQTPRQTYGLESNFTLIPFSGIFQYGEGIGIYMNTSDGNFDFQFVNLTKKSIGQTSYNISFNNTFYPLGSPLKFNYTISDSSSSGHYYFFDTKQTEISSGNFYTNSYDLNPNPGILIGNASGTITPSVFTDLISIYEVCIATGGINVYCKSVQYGQVGDNVTITGNLSIAKTNYNLSETVSMKYNMSTTGRIIIQKGTSHAGTIIFEQQAFSGTNKIINYTVQSVDSFPNIIRLQYLRNGTWVTLATQTYNAISQLSSVNFEKDNQYQGENMIIDYTINQTGYIKLVDSNGIEKFNYSVLTSGGYVDTKSYNILFTDPSGTWNVFLYNASMLQFATDSINIYESVISTTPTPVPTKEITSILDAAAMASEIVVGKQTDENGEVSDVQIKKTGNNIFVIFLAAVIICLISGVYYAVTNQKRR